MLITEISRNLHQESPPQKPIDWLFIEWFEATKRIQRLKTSQGMEVAIRLLGAEGRLKDGDILYEEEQGIVAVAIIPCEVIVVQPTHTLDIASISSEIGNKHLPLFVEKEELLLPLEGTIYQWLQKNGFRPRTEKRKLKTMFNANVDPSHHKMMRSATQKIRVLIKE